MKKGQKLWSREELIIAINLYCKLPFGKLHRSNPQVIHLAELIGRTPSSIAYKLVNFASLDPSLQARGIKGASNASKLEKNIWDEFYNNWEELPFESEKLLAELENKSIEELNDISTYETPEGRTREQIVKVRINQSFFRSSILASYNNTCCITGLKNSELLIAGHIKPWSLDEKNRLNPRNGIAINALHDKAFDRGLITINSDFLVRISPTIEEENSSFPLSAFDGKQILLPEKEEWFPSQEALKWHNKEVFML
ncbi:HNH endonuclease [Salegentibacter salegens]|uniref:Putative restriction endonuclease n=1 Tax=Salegentibacter salegens TaxID=143223 RepID=A0A1M7KG58_9FLAO|nr:HNH endonuclease [Salegentibacter salegens]PRX49639.1 putative restriction endonuclease [Salegentibacter salegens]SHM64260.1 putative restriction endonuclease [Salegentibacter salegens]